MLCKFRHFLEATKNIFYWVPSKPQPVQVGMKVPPSGTNFEGFVGPYKKIAEEVFEKVRQEVSPNSPSRLNGIFLCPDPNTCKYYLRLHKTSIYEVELISGNYVVVDAHRFGDCMTSMMKPAVYAHRPLEFDEAYKYGRYCAEEYWLSHEDLENPEVLADRNANVVVLRQVT